MSQDKSPNEMAIIGILNKPKVKGQNRKLDSQINQ